MEPVEKTKEMSIEELANFVLNHPGIIFSFSLGFKNIFYDITMVQIFETPSVMINNEDYLDTPYIFQLRFYRPNRWTPEIRAKQSKSCISEMIVGLTKFCIKNGGTHSIIKVELSDLVRLDINPKKLN